MKMSHAIQQEQQRTFHLFSRLPAELRWKIWEYNLPGPRLVSVRCGSDELGCPRSSPPPFSTPDGPGRSPSSSRLSPSSLSRAPLSSGCMSPARIPANLHTCHEARREALRHYQPSFGIAHQPGKIFFSPAADILYFGPRDGFMAAEAQLRTVLTLADPADLARVTRVALNDAVFWSAALAPPPPLPPPSSTPNHHTAANNHHQHRMLASSLLVDVLHLLRERLPGLRELVFVPRDENPLYSGDACLVAPTMAQSRLARVVRGAMAVVFSSGIVGDADAQMALRPWDWKIMTLSADADVPVYGRQVLGWDRPVAAGSEGYGGDGGEAYVVYGNAHGPGYTGGGLRRGGGGPGGGGGRGLGHNLDHYYHRHQNKNKGRDFARLSVLQESVRRQFMQMEMAAGAAAASAYGACVG